MTLRVSKLLVQEGSTLSIAIKVITREGSGICFVVRGMKLVGVITDGDIRRALLDGLSLADLVEDVMEKDFFSLQHGADIKKIQNAVDKYKIVPIVNESGEVIDLATPKRFHQIPLVQPVFDGNELEYVTDCIINGWVSSQGKYVKDFESNFAEYIGARDALAVSNGTVALHLALLALGIGPGDEVLVPNLTFAATINAVLYVGATPVLVDVEPLSMGINLQDAEKLLSKKTRAIIAVHLYGYPVNINSLLEFSNSHNLYVIEDCAEALGSKFKGIHVGIFGDASTFSFFGNKTITTGEGGMVLFKCSLIHEKAKILRDHGMSLDKRYWHDTVGFNYRLSNLQAAVGVAQLERADYFIQKKRDIANQYNLILGNSLPIFLPQDGGDFYNSYWLYTIVLNHEARVKRDDVIGELRNSGIESRPIFYPLHRMPPYLNYVKKVNNFSISEKLSENGISLPSSIALTESEILRICECIKRVLKSSI